MIKRDTSMGERCSLCWREVPKDMTVIRKVENDHILCVLCLVEIAEMAQAGFKGPMTPFENK